MARAPHHRPPPPPVRAPARRGVRARPVDLAGLRGFAAAARTLSFTAAAEALHLTQSAISRQVAGLEREVGHKLFARRTRALALTPAGEQLARAVREGLATIDLAVDRIRGTGAAQRVSVTTYPSFASTWLLPRLAAFQSAHPQVDIRVDASDRIVDLERDGIDVALRRCPAERAPRGSIVLMEEHMTPVLSPRLALGTDGAALAPADLLRLPLIDQDTRVPANPDSWRAWFDFAGVDLSERAPAGVLFVGYSDMSLQAAARHQGVALAQSPLYEDYTSAGQLVVPFPSLRLQTGYVMVLHENPASRARPEVAQFRDWLLSQFRRPPA